MSTPTSTPTSRPRSLVGPVVVAVGAALVAAAVAFGGSGSDPGEDPRVTSPASVPTTGGSVLPNETTLARRVADDPLAMGRVDAPVVLVAYSDFQCPFCGRFGLDTQPTLVREFVDTGVLRIEWRDFPYLSEQSTDAARAARAAGAQGRFWQFHDALYARKVPARSGKLTDAVLTGLARDLKLDVARFTTDRKSTVVAQAVERDFQQGQQIGVNSTPTFLVNGQPLVGAQPTEVFVEAVRQAAKATAG